MIIEESAVSEELKAIAQRKGMKIGSLLPCEGPF
jgi:F-box/leucine-rich repeat protein 2/20